MAEHVLPEGRLVKVEFEVRLPAAATEAQIEEWLGLHMGINSMTNDNPLGRADPEAFDAITFTDTRMNGRHERFDERQEGTKTYFRERIIRTPA